MASASALAQKRIDAAIMRNRRRIEQTQQLALAKELRRYFMGLAGRLRLPREEKSFAFDSIALKLRETKEASTFPSGDNLVDWNAEELRLSKVVHKAYINIADDVIKGVADAVGVELNFDTGPKFDRNALDAIGAGVKDINQSTRVVVNNTVRRGLAAGSAPSTIAKELIGQIQGWGGGASGKTIAHSRAMVVARTETAIAYNVSAARAYEKALIKTAKCLDAPDCGWLTHDDPERAAGKLVPISEIRLHPVAHPNCVRAFSPVVNSFEKPDPVLEPAKPAPDLYANPYVPGKNYTRENAWGSKWGDKANLTDSQSKALRIYQGSSYRNINGLLRGTPGYTDETYRQYVKDIDGAIKKNKLPRATILSRGSSYSGVGVSNDGSKPVGPQMLALVGQTLVDKGYFSTAVGQPFSKKVILELKAPKGQKAAWMSDKNVGSLVGGETQNGELEVLLPRNIQVRIDKVEEVTDGGYAAWKVFGTILPS